MLVLLVILFNQSILIDLFTDETNYAKTIANVDDVD